MQAPTMCPECQAQWPVAPARPSARSGCAECRREYKRRWDSSNRETRRGYGQDHYRKNTEEIKSKSRNRWHETGRRFKKYGITREDFELMLEEQNGACAICSKEVDERAHIDHNHDTGEIRGLLCSSCNRALGYFGDDTKTLERALEYLRERK